MHYSIITPPDLLRVRAATFALLTSTNLEGRQTIQPECTGFSLNQPSQHATHSQQARSAMFLQRDSKVIHSTDVPLRAPFLSPRFEPVLPCVKVVLPYQSLIIPHSTYRHARCLDCKRSYGMWSIFKRTRTAVRGNEIYLHPEAAVVGPQMTFNEVVDLQDGIV